MTKTTNYQLPQWEANDPVRREDFNQAMAKIDAGLTQEAETLATGLADVRSEQQQDNAATKQETFRKMEDHQLQSVFAPAARILSGTPHCRNTGRVL